MCAIVLTTMLPVCLVYRYRDVYNSTNNCGIATVAAYPIAK